jgi:hypothetical protein
MHMPGTNWLRYFLGCLLILPAGCSLEQVLVQNPKPAGQAPAAMAPATPDSPPAPPPDSRDKPGGSAVDCGPPVAPAPAEPRLATVWGLVGLRGFVYGENVAPNGLEYNQLFALDMDFNLMLWREQRLYLFADTTFWGQKPGAGVTNASQGVFDFSKRELDFNLGAAWNYYSALEARLFAYSDNNLNRGQWLGRPSGFNDGVGLEQRYYLGPTYADLGTDAFDVARATFVSLGFYPTKDLVDNIGMVFKPGPFAHAYLTFDLTDDWSYLYLDTQFIGERTFRPKLFLVDGGAAVRPFAHNPRLEFRLGSNNSYDIQWHDFETCLYGAVRYVY